MCFRKWKNSFKNLHFHKNKILNFCSRKYENIKTKFHNTTEGIQIDHKFFFFFCETVWPKEVIFKCHCDGNADMTDIIPLRHIGKLSWTRKPISTICKPKIDLENFCWVDGWWIFSSFDDRPSFIRSLIRIF